MDQVMPEACRSKVKKDGYTKRPAVHPTHHAHTHQHNVKIEPIKTIMEMSHSKNKGLEPLFMAISGFVGMAVMFLFSMVFLPKLTGIKSRGVGVTKGSPDQIVSLSSVLMDAIEGYDCSERISCEVNRTIRVLNLHDNRFTKLLQRYMPKSFTRKIERVKKQAMAQTKKKCALIQCKRKMNKTPPVKIKANKNKSVPK